MSFKPEEYVKYKGDEEKLDKNKIYKIERVHYSLDGAYDWDDLFLEGVEGKFCEFDFEYPEQNRDVYCNDCQRWNFKDKKVCPR